MGKESLELMPYVSLVSIFFYLIITSYLVTEVVSFCYWSYGAPLKIGQKFVRCVLYLQNKWIVSGPLLREN